MNLFLGDITDAEAKQIIDQHEKDLAAALAKLDMSKLRQLSELEKKLAERRAKREADLRDKHEKEALQAGLPPPPVGKSVRYCVCIKFKQAHKTC